MIKSWWKNWGLIDLLALGLGLLLCIAYVAYLRAEGFQRPLLDLWPNIATEIVGVWVSVRIIDALIGRREERSRVRDAVVSNLNFMMSICQDLPLHFYDWRLNDLSNELMWFEEKRAAQRKLLKKHFTNEERSGIDAVIKQVKDVHRLSSKAAATKSEVEAVDDAGQAWDRPEQVKQLMRAYHRHIDSGGRDQEVLSEALEAVRRGHEWTHPEEKRAELERIVSTVTRWIEHAGQVRASVHGVEASLQELRRTIAAGA